MDKKLAPHFPWLFALGAIALGTLFSIILASHGWTFVAPAVGSHTTIDFRFIPMPRPPLFVYIWFSPVIWYHLYLSFLSFLTGAAGR